MAFTLSAMLPLLLFVGVAITAAGTGAAALIGRAGTAGQSALVVRLGIALGSLSTLVLGAALFAPVVAVGYLVAELLGLQVERDSIARTALDGQGRGGAGRQWLVAAAFSAGLQAGFFLVPIGIFGSPVQLLVYQGSLLRLLPIPFATLLWFAGATLLTWLWLTYVRFFTRRWLAGHVGAAPPRRRHRLLTLASAVLLGVILIPVLIWQASAWSEVSIPVPAVAVVIAVGIALAIYAGVFVVSWVLFSLFGRAGSRRCPTCGQRTRQAVAVGRACEHCGGDLAPWLFADTG
jgi:hypothetical protein